MKQTLCAAGILFGALVSTLSIEGALAQRYAFAPAAEAPQSAATPISISTTPHWFALKSLAAGQSTDVGALTYLYGYVLKSDNPAFGGYSALNISADGKDLLALSDRGHVLSARISELNAETCSFDNAVISPLLGKGGAKLSIQAGDAESLIIKGDRAFVGFERVDRLDEYRLRGKQLDYVSPIAGLARQGFKGNNGLEAIISIDAKTIAGISETKNNTGAALGVFIPVCDAPPCAPLTDGFTYNVAESFSVTDIDDIDDKRALLIERSYSRATGVRVRLMEVLKSDIAPGADVSGRLLARLALPEHRVDNLEGISVHTNETGETLLYLISDDNHSARQETQLLVFRLNDEKAP
ncbi:MAG: esterase-like activity of phytase family protein [Pseudomonadota bacterium]